MAKKGKTKFNNKPLPLILFYSFSPRAFRATLIGYLYEISQAYPVIFLSEELDSETEKAIKNKKLFPKLREIIPVHQFSRKKTNPFKKNRQLFKLAKDIILSKKPNVVIASSDKDSLFELYLLRFAQKINAIKITFQTGNAAKSELTAKWVDLTNAYLRFPAFLPLFLRLFLTKCRKYLGHFFYYWLLPLTVKEKPFFGKSSYILRKGQSGMRNSDCQVVFSKKDYDIFQKEGVPSEKLFILNHPLTRKTRKIFKEIYFHKLNNIEKKQKIATLMLPTEVEIGLKRNDHSLINKEKREEYWIKIVKLIADILSRWKIYIKPHPDSKNIAGLKKEFEAISKRIKVVSPDEIIERYIFAADLIVELPLSGSTALFTSFLLCPEKPVISLDFYQEFFGDYYKNFTGIEYVDREEKFINIVKLIRDNKFHKKLKSKSEMNYLAPRGEVFLGASSFGNSHPAEKLRGIPAAEIKNFSDSIELLNFLLERSNLK